MASVTFVACSVSSVLRPSKLIMLLPHEQAAWCNQFSQEGYDVIHVPYAPSSNDSIQDMIEASKNMSGLSDIGLLTYGVKPSIAHTVMKALVPGDYLKVCVHFCPSSNLEETAEDILSAFAVRNSHGRYIPTIYHLSSDQLVYQAALLPLIDPTSFDYELTTAEQPPAEVYAYPNVPHSPPFPFLLRPPGFAVAGETIDVDPYMRSAHSLSHSRTLAILKNNLGPHFNLEKLWEAHTYHEFVTRDSQKTMDTMVSSPYVNHVATLTGGVGYADLSRFYKYHFTGKSVTPPDMELITVSRTVGSDRIIDEMVIKCTHTTEIDYFLPGVKPTGKPLSIAAVGIVAFRGDKLCFEHIYWDQASVLVQLGLLNPEGLPVAGKEVADKVLNPYGIPSNVLLKRWKESANKKT